MMTNMFIMFDPNLGNTPLNLFLSLTLVTTMTKSKNYWMKNSKFKNLNMNISVYLINLSINMKPMINMLYSITITVTILNLTNIMPLTFYLTANLMVNLCMTLTMWGLSISYMMKNLNILMINLSPKGTPMVMMMIINSIELNSLLFQIISLTMRLMINMMMGHIIINMMNNFIAIMIYMMIEMFIIIIQTYIFITLNLLNLSNMN